MVWYVEGYFPLIWDLFIFLISYSTLKEIYKEGQPCINLYKCLTRHRSKQKEKGTTQKKKRGKEKGDFLGLINLWHKHCYQMLLPTDVVL